MYEERNVWYSFLILRSRPKSASCLAFSESYNSSNSSLLLVQSKIRISSNYENLGIAMNLKTYSAVVECTHRRRKTFQEEVAMAKWKVKYKDIKINSRQSVASLLKVGKRKWTTPVWRGSGHRRYQENIGESVGCISGSIHWHCAYFNP